MSKTIAMYCLALLCLWQTNAQKKGETAFPVDRKRFDRSYLKELKKSIEENELKQITSVIVLQSGTLVAEAYYGGTDRKSLHDTRSLTKSFTSTLLGIAIKEGHIKSLDQTLKEFYELKDYQNYSEAKADVTLRSLLTMNSGFDGFDFDPSSIGNEERMYPTKDWVKFALDLPMKQFSPNDLRWQYFTAGVVLLGDILDKHVPGGLETFAREKLFAPLGITTVQWQYTPSGVVNTAGSCRLSSLDFAKYGQLYNAKGKWKDKQILTPEWIDATFTRYFELPDDLAYGYLFWNKSYTYKGVEYETFAASGNGGNKVFVFPSIDLVVVITSTAYNQPYMHRQADKIMTEYVLPGILK